jgi:hypothetical protein
VLNDSVGVDDCICLGFVVSQCVWWDDRFCCVELLWMICSVSTWFVTVFGSLNVLLNVCGSFIIIIYFCYVNVYISPS